MNRMLWEVSLFLLGPALAIAALLVATRAANRNWQFGLRGVLMLLTLVAVGMGAVAVLMNAKYISIGAPCTRGRIRWPGTLPVATTLVAALLGLAVEAARTQLSGVELGRQAWNLSSGDSVLEQEGGWRCVCEFGAEGTAEQDV
jgi:hypothetical protein